jgi:hypothetical protein
MRGDLAVFLHWWSEKYSIAITEPPTWGKCYDCCFQTSHECLGTSSFYCNDSIIFRKFPKNLSAGVKDET